MCRSDRLVFFSAPRARFEVTSAFSWRTVSCFVNEMKTNKITLPAGWEPVSSTSDKFLTNWGRPLRITWGLCEAQTFCVQLYLSKKKLWNSKHKRESEQPPGSHQAGKLGMWGRSENGILNRQFFVLLLWYVWEEIVLLLKRTRSLVYPLIPSEHVRQSYIKLTFNTRVNRFQWEQTQSVAALWIQETWNVRSTIPVTITRAPLQSLSIDINGCQQYWSLRVTVTLDCLSRLFFVEDGGFASEQMVPTCWFENTCKVHQQILSHFIPRKGKKQWMTAIPRCMWIQRLKTPHKYSFVLLSFWNPRAADQISSFPQLPTPSTAECRMCFTLSSALIAYWTLSNHTGNHSIIFNRL